MSGYHTRLRWRKRQHCLPIGLNKQTRSWLFDMGSLTSRLIENCDGEFAVKVLSVRRDTPTPDEISVLNMQIRSQALIREVLLTCNKKPVVYARTIIPVSSLRGVLRGLALLGNKPLGAVLFADKSMRRKPMEITMLSPKHKFYAWTRHKGKEKIWGRRSVFILKEQELLVSEFFLPDLL